MTREHNKGRPFNEETPLGQLIKRHGLRVTDVCKFTGINMRVITRYLNGHRMISRNDQRILGEFFELEDFTILCDYEVSQVPMPPMSQVRQFFELKADEVDLEAIFRGGSETAT